MLAARPASGISRSRLSSNATASFSSLHGTICTRPDNRMGAHLYKGSSSQPPRLTAFSWLPCTSTMTDKSKRPKGPGDGVLSTLNLAIDGLNLAKEVASVTPAKAAFGTVAILLTMIRVNPVLSCNEILYTHASPGHDGQRTGLCGTRTVLC